MSLRGIADGVSDNPQPCQASHAIDISSKHALVTLRGELNHPFIADPLPHGRGSSNQA